MKEPHYRSLNSQFNPIDMDHTKDQNDFQREDTSQDEEKPKYIVESEPIGNIPESETEPKATEQMEAIVSDTPAPAPPRRSTRGKRMPERYRQDGERAYVVMTTSPSVKDALAGPDSAAWTAAMEKEKEQLKKYGVYEELDNLPSGKKTVDTKWVLREKFDQTGKLEKRKARLTARGFTQIYGLHYDNTYAPVARPDSWRSLLVLALRDRWIVLQADIVAAYLNAPLKHEIYISDPSVTKDKVWRLHKALCGLKQSAYEWNTTMTMLFERGGLSPMKADPACYIGNYIRVATHVDDYLIVARQAEDLVELIQAFEQNVEIDHRGKPSSFLNIECRWESLSTSGLKSTPEIALRLTQTRAIEALCTEYKITYGVSSPMSLTDDLTIPAKGETIID